MAVHTLETDYLVVGSGAAGMAFTDALIADSGADVIVIDRRHAPGGHWNDAYPFVRLHQPSAYYGANSLPLGNDTIDQTGLNQGYYEQASAPEICAYFDRVMRQQLLPSGRVRYFPMCEYVGATRAGATRAGAREHRFVARLTGEAYEVTVRRALVDATYLEPAIPATTKAPFAVDPGVRCVAVGDLPRAAEPADGYVIIGAGKTAVDACLWLLQTGVPASAIRWIRPRDAWFHNRSYAQCGQLVGSLIEGVALQMEAAVNATSIADLFDRLEACGQLLRIDPGVAPTMYRGATMSERELEQLRHISEVVRLGQVRRIEADRIVLERGTIPTSAGQLHVHCAAAGLNPAPTRPIFETDRLTLQPVRTGLIPFNAAIVGFIESTDRDIAEKNRLCPPNRLPNTPLDWIRGVLIGMNADYAWSKEADISAWLDRARLNPSHGIKQRNSDPRIRQASMRYGLAVRPGLAALERLLSTAEARAASI